MRSLRLLVRHTGTVLVASFLAMPLAATGQVNVFTWHNDNFRTGMNRSESILTRARVNSSNFGLLRQFQVDGKVDAQPLYVSAIEMPPNGSHNVVFVATEHDSVYAFDADTGKQFWQVSLLSSGETPSDPRGCDQVTPEIGVTSTPAIVRRTWYDGSLYVVAMSKDASGNYHQRIHALDLWTGSEQFGGPTEVQGTYPGSGDNSSNGNVVFDPKQYKDRAALLLQNGEVYTSFGSHCDSRPYTGWTIAYDQVSLQQTRIFNFAPNGTGAAPWNSGAGPAGDNASLYFALGNGTFDTTLTRRGFPIRGDFGNSLVRLVPRTGGGLTPFDYWTMYNANAESGTDKDLGSGGVMLLPVQTDANGKARHLAVAAGKDSNLYVVDRDKMGKFDPNSNGTLYQELDAALPGGVYSSPAYFNGSVYYGSVNSPLKGFVVDKARLVGSPSSTSPNTFGFPGTTPSISSHGGISEGIVWAVENSSPAILHAYDASDLGTELYNSNQAGARDHFGAGNKFIVPTIANGKVFVGTQNSVAVFGIAPQSQPLIPDGLYDIINHSSGLLLNDPQSSKMKVQIIQFPERGALNEHWFFSYQGNGYYLIQNVSSGLFLTDPNAFDTPGPLLQNVPLSNDTQLWSLIPNGTGYVIQNKATSLVMDDPSRNPNPCGIIVWHLVSTDPAKEAFYINQIWTIRQAH